jgi:hypothetical protein
LRVIPGGSESIYTTTRVSPDGREVDVCFTDTNLERFLVLIDELEWVK